MAVDPVCGMRVDEKSAKFLSHHGGVTYYFCSKMCKDKFDREPVRYLKK